MAHTLKNVWEEELGAQIGDEDGLSSTKSCSINARHQLIQFTVMLRRIVKKLKCTESFLSFPLYLIDVDVCLTHLFWTCPKQL